MIVKTYKDYLAQVNKKTNKYNQTNYTNIELKNIDKLKNIIKDYLFKTEEAQRGENQYANLSNSIDLKNFKNYVDITTSDHDLQCIEIKIKNINDNIIKNIIIDHILDRFDKLENIICKEYKLSTKNNELHFFDYDGSNTFVITNDKLLNLIKMIKKK